MSKVMKGREGRHGTQAGLPLETVTSMQYMTETLPRLHMLQTLTVPTFSFSQQFAVSRVEVG